MSAIVAAASPIELAALWRLGLLTARDVVKVCGDWLEQDLDEDAPDVAVLAGEIHPRLADVAAGFERALVALAGPPLTREGALPIALRLHLAVAMVQPDERFIEAMDLVMGRFKSVAERRLVVHPHRLDDRPDEVFAEQELGLEYVYGAYDTLDDVLRGELWTDEDPAALKSRCLETLRSEVAVLHAHLATL
ncbi:MAG: hypothetical protein J7521_15955 [Caulobacter sp.]|nr:hypothetical protein [Caulobacter sp.]